MRKLSLKKIKIAAIGNAHFIKGGNETGSDCPDLEVTAATCKTNCDWPCNHTDGCSSNPGTTLPNNTVIKTKTCPINVRNF